MIAANGSANTARIGAVTIFTTDLILKIFPRYPKILGIVAFFLIQLNTPFKAFFTPPEEPFPPILDATFDTIDPIPSSKVLIVL